jgi:predicted nuclease of predicted toxin-antitoxin system
MLLLDQGLPRTTPHHLQRLDIEAVHAADVGLSTADDATILQFARERSQIIATLDADFHIQLALSSAAKPSVIRIRIEGLRAEELARLLSRVLEQCREDLESGAMVSITDKGIRVRRLPLLGVSQPPISP